MQRVNNKEFRPFVQVGCSSCLLAGWFQTYGQHFSEGQIVSTSQGSREISIGYHEFPALLQNGQWDDVIHTFGLSKREVEVCQAIVRGLGNRQLARALHISYPAVRFHLKNIYRKTGTADHTNLVLLLVHDFLLKPRHDSQATKNYPYR